MCGCPVEARYPEAARQGYPAQKLLVVVSVAKLFWKLGETKEEFLRLAVLHFLFLSVLLSGFLISLLLGLLRKAVSNPGSSFYQILLRGPQLLFCLFLSGVLFLKPQCGEGPDVLRGSCLQPGVR